MGYAHGTKWTDELVIEKIKEVMRKLGIKTFPTHSQILECLGNNALSCKISKYGGSRFWANKMGLEIKQCESETGNLLELICIDKLSELGFDCEQMKPRYPYDIAANKHIKIDVKSGYAFSNYGNSKYFTFNLEKLNPTCDIYIVYCLNEDKTILKTYIIPSIFLQGKTQLALGYIKSQYDNFIDKWEWINEYDGFYKMLGVINK